MVSIMHWRLSHSLFGPKPRLTLRLKCAQEPLIAPWPLLYNTTSLADTEFAACDNTLEEGQTNKKIASRKRKQAKVAKEKRLRERLEETLKLQMVSQNINLHRDVQDFSDCR